MTKFLNGPAAGQHLSLGRSPYFLRVCRTSAGKWDALDQLDDTPKPTEEIHVYRRATTPMTMHVDGRDPKTGKRFGRWTSIADYVLHDEQPDDPTARNPDAWPQWCAQQAKKINLSAP
jgi:hypothetical protein